jgi:hypothetical protein
MSLYRKIVSISLPALRSRQDFIIDPGVFNFRAEPNEGAMPGDSDALFLNIVWRGWVSKVPVKAIRG